MRKLIVLFIACSALTATAERKTEIIDGVVATVNNEPITLHEVCEKLNPPRRLSFKAAKEDSEVQQVLDQMILNQLIEYDAEEKRVGTSDAEIERYIDDVAARNNLSRDGFKKALKQEGLTLDSYKEQVRMEILRSKLAGSLFRSGATVSDGEIDGYLKEHPELLNTTVRLKLRQIFVVKGSGADEKVKAIESGIADGKEFATLAVEYSDSPDAQQGGLLGVIAEKDLNPMIFDAVIALSEGETSEVVTSDNGFHMFKVEERFGGAEDSEEQVRTQVRELMKRQKIESKMQTYFTATLYDHYGVDKKL